MATQIKQDKIIISGKRKTAVAKLKLVAGKGNILFNLLPISEMSLFHRLALLEPIRVYQAEMGEALENDFIISVTGGGREGQIQAARLAIAKALIHITGSETLRRAFIKYDRNMIVQDPRRKETRKPGDSRARARMQTSYR